MPGTARVAIVSVGVAVFAIGIGYAVNAAWATSTWPWPDSSLSHLFVGSILAAFAAAFIWLGAVGEFGVLNAGSITVSVMSGGSAIYLLTLVDTRHDLVPYAVWFGIVALGSGITAYATRHVPIRDTRATPAVVRVSFGLFAVVLLLAAAFLIARQAIFPWTLNKDSSVIFGCIFLGDACYFLVALRSARWDGARGQLLSFLAYDLVLLPRFVVLLGRVHQDQLLSLVVYLTVLLYSAGLAIYYLFLNRDTRSWVLQTTNATATAPTAGRG